jgi:hypothetical protein
VSREWTHIYDEKNLFLVCRLEDFFLKSIVAGTRFPVDIFCRLPVLIISCAQDVDRILNGVFCLGDTEEIKPWQRKGLSEIEPW